MGLLLGVCGICVWTLVCLRCFKYFWSVCVACGWFVLRRSRFVFATLCILLALCSLRFAWFIIWGIVDLMFRGLHC